MRSWYPIKASSLDNKRLLAEHNEILIMAKAIHATKTNTKYGYKHHPETLRWTGHTKAMALRHEELALEMKTRGFNHKSPWPDHLIDSLDTDGYPTTYWEPLEVMKSKLEEKQGGRLSKESI